MSDRAPAIVRTALGSAEDGPYALAVAGGGSIWAALVHSGRIAECAPGEPVQIHDLGNPGCRPSQLAVGPDGAVWFTRNGDDRIGRIESAAESFPVPAGSGPYGIAAGPDDALWFTAITGEAIGRIATDGTVSLFALPDGGGMPSMITRGPDDALWFTLNRTGAIGRIDVTGSITLHPLPDPECGPVGIAADGDALWFTELGAGRVGRMTPDGSVQEFDLP